MLLKISAVFLLVLIAECACSGDNAAVCEHLYFGPLCPLLITLLLYLLFLSYAILYCGNKYHFSSVHQLFDLKVDLHKKFRRLPHEVLLLELTLETTFFLLYFLSNV